MNKDMPDNIWRCVGCGKETPARTRNCDCITMCVHRASDNKMSVKTAGCINHPDQPVREMYRDNYGHYQAVDRWHVDHKTRYTRTLPKESSQEDSESTATEIDKFLEG